jgi:hypothetical protein
VFSGGTVLDTITTPLRLPRAHLDSISTNQDLLAVFSLAIRRPLRGEVIALLMDSKHRGIGLLSFDTPTSCSALIDQLIGLCSTTDVATSIAIASVRPSDPLQSTDAADFIQMQQHCQRAGIELHQWIVICRGAVHHINASSGDL